MSELTDLYQEVILDHNRRPRNYGALAGANRTAQGHNPLCGDRLTLYVEVAGDRIAGVSFEGSGCAISKASASIMTDAIKGRSLGEVAALFDRFHQMITSPYDRPVDEAALGKLAAFAGVREFPVRVKCASLAWHTLKAALAESQTPVKTE
jgi:nitrogen fixation NifU-like protein